MDLYYVQAVSLRVILRDSNPCCSRCGELSALNLVTMPHEESTGPGRLLVYCSLCRTNSDYQVDVSIPLELVDEDLLAGLYEMRKTSSDPETAIHMVFGAHSSTLQERLERILAGLYNP